MTTTKRISFITALLVLLVAIGSFALSYSNLRLLAAESGINGWLSYVWPLLIDASLIVFSLAVVNAYLHNESTWKQWSLVGIYTIATVSFNVVHAPASLQAQVVAAIAPVSLFFSFELLMGQLRSSVIRHGLAHSIEQMSQQVSQLELEVSQKAHKVGSLEQRIESLRIEIDELQAQKNGSYAIHLANDARMSLINERREKVYELLEQEVSHADIAGELAVSLATIKRDIKVLNGRAS
jgi:Trp operon repressor